MTAPKVDLAMDRGAFFEWDFQLLDGPRKDSPPLNLTGYTARMQVRGSVDSPEAELDLSTENGCLVLTPLTGYVHVAVQVPTSDLPDSDHGVFDLFLISPTGKPFRAVQGAVRFYRNVTRAVKGPA